ncbi:AzlD domain-containing protein [Exilibacterium tricleocarpae]|uniref:AzlD domain-containing protein n=1 Tax=Exilibacterium tricleocarpae TaxID=2591008 RepID=A0A545SLY4_9GAMM|nr:AzlD domain-containing protein [Exilibacterium tricleocarpae]TQV65997.1 AzlD domain-containing protein [Exilibacterium tricleocarpae]
MTIWLTLLLMAAVTFATRYAFLEPRVPIRLNNAAQRFLGYSAPAVLTAITAPIVFARGQQLDLRVDNIYLWAALTAVTVAYFSRNTLLTVAVSMPVFFGLKHYLQ